MTCDHPAADLLPFLVNDTLLPEERRRVEAHLGSCAACQAELALWQEVSASVRAEAAAALPHVSGSAWQRIAWRLRAATAPRTAYLAALVGAQFRLVRHGLWFSSALVMALGVVVAWLAGRAGVVSAVAPLVAVFGVSHLYGPEHDAAFELTAATPTSPRQILLARLVLVFGYDLVLALAASVGFALIVPNTLAGILIASWLAPMTFLSALALVCSVSIGSHAAVGLAFGLWLLRGFLTGAAVPASILTWGAAYEAWWTQSSWLYALAALMVSCGVWLAGNRERQLTAAYPE